MGKQRITTTATIDLEHVEKQLLEALSSRGFGPVASNALLAVRGLRAQLQQAAETPGALETIATAGPGLTAADLREIARSALRDAEAEHVAWCPQCGPVSRCDEDGCCLCGSDASGDGADAALALAVRVRDLEAVLMPAIGGGLSCLACDAHTVIVGHTRSTPSWHRGGCPVGRRIARSEPKP